jgi:hypothetical protein
VEIIEVPGKKHCGLFIDSEGSWIRDLKLNLTGQCEIRAIKKC